MTAFPTTPAERDRFVLERRPPRPPHNPWTYQGVTVEDERAAGGQIARTATVFLTGRECPWRCVMCDLWRYTTPTDTPPGAIAGQIRAAREQLDAEEPPVSQIKLYNAGSFFDPRAVPEEDYPGIASTLDGYSTVIVESHPSLVGPRVDAWLDSLSAACRRPPQVEVAMGLETAHPVALERLHKRMTVDHFAAAATALVNRGVAVRAFLLIAPPFIAPDEQARWLLQSVDVAFDAGASVVSLIPTRPGNGALDAIEDAGFFAPPTLDEVERSFANALGRLIDRGRLFVDLWDLERFSMCPRCFPARRDRLRTMNLEQRVVASIACRHE